MSSKQQIRTPLTDLLKVKHPIMLAGMGIAAGPKLAAAVTNAGGIGVIGGYGYGPEGLRAQIEELKANLDDPNAPFGVDLLIPKIGGTARKTNEDYNKGRLRDLVDIIIASGAALFVSAIGLPPPDIVARLHKGGVLYMNMIGHPKHVRPCLANGADIICAQGGEGGGHTGDIPLSILVPAVAALARGHRSAFTGREVVVVAAGGIGGGEGLAASLMLGAAGVWVGTRFVVAEEAGAPRAHQESIISAGWDDTVRTVIFSGRPMRVRKTPYITDWEENRQAEIKELTDKGIVPFAHDLDVHPDDENMIENRPFIMGAVAAVINARQSANAIVEEMMAGAVTQLEKGSRALVSKL